MSTNMVCRSIPTVNIKEYLLREVNLLNDKKIERNVMAPKFRSYKKMLTDRKTRVCLV